MADKSGGSGGAGKSKCQSKVGCAITLADPPRSEPDDGCASFLLHCVTEGGRVIVKGLKRLRDMDTVCVWLSSRGPNPSLILIPGTNAEPGEPERGEPGTSQSPGRRAESERRRVASSRACTAEGAATLGLFAKG